MNVAVDTNAASVVEVTSPSLVRVKAETTHKRPQSPQSHSKEALIPDPTVAQAEIVHRDCPQSLARAPRTINLLYLSNIGRGQEVV